MGAPFAEQESAWGARTRSEDDSVSLARACQTARRADKSACLQSFLEWAGQDSNLRPCIKSSVRTSGDELQRVESRCKSDSSGWQRTAKIGRASCRERE